MSETGKQAHSHHTGLLLLLHVAAAFLQSSLAWTALLSFASQLCSFVHFAPQVREFEFGLASSRGLTFQLPELPQLFETKKVYLARVY